jgi:hypothetical protein
MKKTTTLIIFLLLATLSQAQAGRIRISFAGFDCYRETWDDILQTDGKGDEVYLNFGFNMASKTGQSKFKYEKRTGVYGDATGPFSNRTSVGSCVDLFGNLRGGIKGGDNYRCNDIVGEYDMADGDILSVMPTIWELDPVADDLNSFTTVVGNMYTTINQKLAPIMIGFSLITGSYSGLVMGVGSLGLQKILAGGQQGELGKAGTRPIGMEKSGLFDPQIVAINTTNAQRIASSNFGNGPGVIAVNYNEVAVGNTRDHGNYTVLLKVEFFPAPAPPANNNPASSNGSTTTNPKNASSNLRKVNMQVNAPAVTGKWTGTYGSGAASTPNFYSFQLNADGSMQLIGANGAVLANGTYTFSNNQLTGTYKYTNGGNFSISAMLSGNTLNGSWGSGTSSTGGGKWVMTKN